jgi:hypothetical protein
LTAALSPFYAGARREYDLAAERHGVVEVNLRFGDRSVALRFAGQRLAEAVLGLGALDARRSGASGEADATIALWEEPLPPAAALPVTWGVDDIGPQGLVRGSGADGVVAVHETASGAVTLVESSPGAAILHRVPSRGSVPWWERAAPLRPALFWALGGERRHLVHAGGVGDARGGVLIAGASGSGKTTVALAALVHGLRYVADDYLLLDSTIEPTAVSVYGTAKLDDGHLRRFGMLAAVRFPPPSCAGEKAVLDVGRAMPGALCGSLPVRAVVVPRIRGGRTRLRRVSPTDALLALGPSTVFQMPFDGGRAVASLAAVVRSVPCFGLDVGDDPAELAGAVERVLDEAAR